MKKNSEYQEIISGFQITVGLLIYSLIILLLGMFLQYSLHKDVFALAVVLVGIVFSIFIIAFLMSGWELYQYLLKDRRQMVQMLTRLKEEKLKREDVTLIDGYEIDYLLEEIAPEKGVVQRSKDKELG